MLAEELIPKTESMSFVEALIAMKAKHKVSRTGWNGQGMYCILMPGYPEGIGINEATAKAHGIPAGTIMKFRPYLALFTAQKDVASWVPSGSDILAEDWKIVF